MAERTKSDPSIDPTTGAELGMGNQTMADGKTVQGKSSQARKS
jgi:Mn-containing catalase